MRVVFNSGKSGPGKIGLDSVSSSRSRVVLHGAEKGEENRVGNTLAMALSSRTITPGNNKKPEETGMTSRIEPYRVSAYNTSKHSENKMHDDTVAKRYRFSGGLVPGVDVMAYMMHLPVAKWGRAFLDRGLIEARFVKPVYDGELTDVTGEERDGVLSIQVESRGELCATGSASLPQAVPSFQLSDFVETAAVSERQPVNA